MQDYVALQEERRTCRRTVADALEVVSRQKLGKSARIGPAEIRTGPFQLPSGQCTAVVQVLSPTLAAAFPYPPLPGFEPATGRVLSTSSLKSLDSTAPKSPPTAPCNLLTAADTCG